LIHCRFSRACSVARTGFVLFLLLLLVISRPDAQGPGSLTVLSAEGRRALPLTMVNNREFVALEELAPMFQLTVRQEAGAITVSGQGQTIILTPDETLASVGGRLISLSAAPTRSGGRVLVPLDFISRALAPVHKARLDLRAPARLLVVGDLRVPRVTVRYEGTANQARLTIDATPRAAGTVGEESGRLTVKFDADAIDPTIPGLPPQEIVLALRVLDPVTLAIDLGPRFSDHQVSTEALDNTSRLVLNLTATPADPGTTAAAPAPSPTVPDRSTFGRPTAPLRTVVLDPGHGGDDVGVRGQHGTTEKELTLAVARRLRATIEGGLGIRVLLTREDDRALPLDRRTAVANNNKADVFISLHANGSPRETAGGVAVHVAAFGEEERARGSIASDRVPVVGGGTREIEIVRWDLAQIRHTERSTEFASSIEQRIRAGVRLDVHPVGRGHFRVLESANMPAVIVEMGYLTNPDEERTLASGEFQSALVQGIFEALLTFRDRLASGGGGEQ
jgi:N-acetylmuramoyl-L-alanine amidase